MRRLITALGIAAVGAAGLLSLAQPAAAAEGKLAINGTTYAKPSGCYQSKLWPLVVGNYTNEYAFIHEQQNCQGRIIEIVPPGSEIVSEFGQSVSIK